MEKRIVSSWRGSADLRNWLEDFTFDTLEYHCKGCRIHAGFIEIYRSAEKRINEVYSNLLKKYPDAGLLATGHSMGAALSLINALELQLAFNIPPERI